MSSIVKMRVAGTEAVCRIASRSASGCDRVQPSMISSSASWFSLRLRVVGEARIVGQLGLAHRAGKAAEEVVGHAP